MLGEHERPAGRTASRLRYSWRGRNRGGVVLFLHGYPMDHRLWRGQVATLDAQYSVLAPDLPGFGGSPLTIEATLPAYARELFALLDRLGVGQMVPVGLSMGGYLVLEMYRQQPDRCLGLVLVDTRADADGPTARESRTSSIMRLRNEGAAGVVTEMVPRLLAPRSLANTRLSGWIEAMFKEQPAGGLIGALTAMRDRVDSLSILQKVTVPTLVVVGAEDHVTPIPVAEGMVAALPHGHLAVIPAAGHLSPLENPRAFNRALRSFLATLAPDAASSGSC
jgi:3-oxoadipate enol-lactonase